MGRGLACPGLQPVSQIHLPLEVVPGVASTWFWLGLCLLHLELQGQPWSEHVDPSKHRG